MVEYESSYAQKTKNSITKGFPLCIFTWLIKKIFFSKFRNKKFSREILSKYRNNKFGAGFSYPCPLIIAAMCIFRDFI